jgi:hypothetical protein
MLRMRDWILFRGLGLGALLWSAACGSGATANKPAADVDEGGAASEGKAEAEGSEDGQASDTSESSGGLPTKCAGSGDVCTPDRKFVDRLCKGNFPSVALALFAKDMPWSRGYLRGETEAWNASGGASESGKLAFDEEVLILRKRSADMGGMQVSGAGGGYDALRWNGSCVTLSTEEVTLDRPPSPKSAKVEFRWLDNSIQEALRKDAKVDELVVERKKECKGAHSGDVSLKCIKADAKLSDAIVQFIRQGGDVGQPEKLP